MGKGKGKTEHAQPASDSPMDAFLQPRLSRPEKPSSEAAADKMAGATTSAVMAGAVPGLGEPLSVQALQEALQEALAQVERKFTHSVEAALSPVISQLKGIQASLAKTTQVADTALEMGLALQEDLQVCKAEIFTLKDKVLTLAADLRGNNLKFRGLEESQEINSDIISFMGRWLATALALEPEIFLLITKAFRLGASKMEYKFPRDIIVVFADDHTKRRVQNLAREKNGLAFQGKQILGFPDLPPEALAIRNH